MTTFALIAEGPTDQVVLERIIEGVCSPALGDVHVNYVQPLQDETDASRSSYGGWEMVLEYCRTKFNNALSTNDFVVIHLDTDAGGQKNFGLELTKGGREKDYRELISNTVAIIADNVGRELFQEFEKRIVVAVSVHSMESWLLLCLFGRDDPKGSFKKLNRELIRTNERPLVKDVRRYTELAGRLKRKVVTAAKGKPGSFREFVLRLEALEPIPETD